MKKAVALVELVFSIVVIGICLSVIPKVAEVSLQNTTLGFRQEYIYELKSLYGSIRNLPLEDKNYCKDDYSTNSLLSQYCISISESGLYQNVIAQSEGVNTRFKGSRAQGTYFGDTVVKISNTSLNNLNLKDILGKEINYKFGNSSKVNTSYSIKLSNLASFSQTISGVKIEGSNVGDLAVFDDKNNAIVNVKVPFTKLGRLDNVYNRIVLDK